MVPLFQAFLWPVWPVSLCLYWNDLLLWLTLVKSETGPTLLTDDLSL